MSCRRGATNLNKHSKGMWQVVFVVHCKCVCNHVVQVGVSCWRVGSYFNKRSWGLVQDLVCRMLTNTYATKL